MLFNMKKQNKIVIFDLDGTLALIDKRREKAGFQNGKRGGNWRTFFAPENIPLDEPNQPVIDTFESLRLSGYVMVIFSGRDSISKQATKVWLKQHNVLYDYIQMRPEGDHTPDDILKKRWLDELDIFGLTKKDVLCVYDDRDKVVKMWRNNGIPTFQVNYGEF